MPTDEHAAIHSEQITISSTDGAQFHGYFAAPIGADAKPGVLVLQEIFGVNSHIRAVTERFARAGYAALAPDVFWRIEPDIELGYDADDIAKGRDLKAQMHADEASRDIAATLDTLRQHPRCNGRAGVTGYCYGGLLSFLAAARLNPDCVSSYYGGGTVDYLGEATAVNCPLQFHFGSEDGSIPVEQIEQIRQATAALPDCEVFVYDGAGHGFHCDQRGSFDRDSAALAWERTLGLFSRSLG